VAIVRDLNRAFDSGNFLTWQVKLFLEGLGWTTVSTGSGGGGLYSAVGEVCTVPQYGNFCTLGTEWGWNYCWRVLESPGPRHEQWLFKHGIYYGDDNSWTISYSPDGNFTRTPTNAPSATVAPTCADEHQLYSGLYGTDKGNLALYHFIGIDAPIGAGAYGFVVATLESHSGYSPRPGVSLVQDPFMNGDPSDPHAWAVGVPLNFDWDLKLASLVHAGTGTEFWATIYGGSWSGGGFLNAVHGVGVDLKERPLPVPYVSENPKWVPGVSYFFFGPGVQRHYPQRVDGEDFVYIGEFLLRGWDKTVFPRTV